MGLKKFLKDNGFITDDDPKKDTGTNQLSPQQSQSSATPQFFPVHGMVPFAGVYTPSSAEVTAAVGSSTMAAPDPAFIKFFESEMAAKNPPGLDYFEFRQQYGIMKSKMQQADPQVILQAVLTSFDLNNVPVKDLISSASFYKGVLTTKKVAFLDDSRREKEQLLAKRESMIKTHAQNIQNKQKELQDLQKRLQQLEQEIHTEQNNMELAKNAGSEVINQFDAAEQKISVACDFMMSAIDADLTKLHAME